MVIECVYTFLLISCWYTLNHCLVVIGGYWHDNSQMQLSSLLTVVCFIVKSYIRKEIVTFKLACLLAA